MLDALLAAFFVVVGLVTADPPDNISVALVVLATAPFAFRRSYPLLVLTISGAASCAVIIRDGNDGVLAFVLLFGAYSVAALRPAWEALVGAGVVAVALLSLFVADVENFGLAELAATGAIFASAMVVGWAMQARARQQEEAAQRAAADMRLHIAQELHDVVAHSLGVIAVQAGVGLHVLDTEPEEARKALEHISRTSRSSLAEIRQLLGVVRADDAGDATYAPAPGLADLPRLAAEVGDAGLAVDLDVGVGVDDGLPPGLELTAYRIVQEALTNALRHARAGRATVTVGAADGSLRVEVADDGQGGGSGAAGGGHGLVGMRERVAVYGGTLDAGPVPGGGFRVAASLPYDQGPPA